MPTISQLPSADTATASDLVPISQGGSTHSISVGALLAQTQPAIIVGPPSLLGRFSIGPGGPDAIAIGDGLSLNNGTLSSSSFNFGSLPLQTSLSPGDQILVTNAGTSLLVGINEIRELFTAGSNISIDPTGVISTSGFGAGGSNSLTALSTITAIASGDLVGVSQGGQDHTIAYASLLDGLTIDMAPSAAAASDSDMFWVAQSSNTMVSQTFSAIWPWLSGKLPSWRRSVIELNANTTLMSATHNNAILVCSSPITISAPTANLGSGFCCEMINASGGSVTLPSNVLTSNGLSSLAPYQCASIQCVTWSGGTTVFASISAGSTATSIPGQPSGLETSSVTSGSVTVSWSAPTSGGAASVYSVQYRVTGTATFLAASQTNGSQTQIVGGLQASTSYDFAVIASNNVGNGPISSAVTAVTLAGAILPGAPSGVTVTNIVATGLTCSWSAPSYSGSGMVYTVQYRVTGQSSWITAASNLTVTTANLTGLIASTSYDIQVTASVVSGSGPPSTVVTARTAAGGGSVTSITWSLAPIGCFVHGSGSIGINAHVNPGTAAIQFGFSTSLASPPTSWTVAVNVNSDLWGQYVSTPASAGSWYGWAEGTDGSCPTVYPTPFTVT